VDAAPKLFAEIFHARKEGKKKIGECACCACCTLLLSVQLLLLFGYMNFVGRIVSLLGIKHNTIYHDITTISIDHNHNTIIALSYCDSIIMRSQQRTDSKEGNGTINSSSFCTTNKKLLHKVSTSLYLARDS
jgi:hypothetical protein